MCPRERFSLYKSLSRLFLCYKKDWAILLHLSYFHYLLPITNYLITNYLLPIISVLAENTLLKTAYHFLLLLVGFDTLTYRKDYDGSPILVGHQDVTSLVMHGPNTADGLHRTYVVMRPDIEALRTLFASLTK